MNNPRYSFEGQEELISPQLVVYPAIIRENLKKMIAHAGGAHRLWPHLKTHKMEAVLRIHMELGISRFKCATIAEAEMAAATGATHLILAYPLVGPNIRRFITLVKTFPNTEFFAIGDDTHQITLLGQAAQEAGIRCNVLLDALFIIGFRWGLAGAAAASALSQLVGGVFPLFYFGRKNKSLLRLRKPVWDGRALVKCCINGSSEFMSEAAVSFVGIFYNIQLLRLMGDDGVAVYGVVMYVCLIFSAVLIGYSNGIGPVISFHFGARDPGELKNLRTKSIRIVGIASAVMFVLSEALARPVSALYFPDSGKLIAETVHAFRIYSAAYLFMGFSIFSSTLFTALNNGEISALISFLRTLVFELGAVLLLPKLIGVDGVYSATVLAELLAAVLGGIFMNALQKKYQY